MRSVYSARARTRALDYDFWGRHGKKDVDADSVTYIDVPDVVTNSC